MAFLGVHLLRLKLVLLCLSLNSIHRASAFINISPAKVSYRFFARSSTRTRIQTHSPFDTTSVSVTVCDVPSTTITSLNAIPEPGPCPNCSDENAYWDGSTLFVCVACGHEWPVEASPEDAADDDIIRDCNGNILESGDTVVLTKDLGKGLKKGLKVTRIRVGDYGDGHDVEASIPGIGTYALKSQFLKKTK